MNRAEGFSLIEVLVAGALLVTVLLGVTAMCLTAQGQLQRSGDHTVATTLGQQRIELLRNQAYNSSELAAGTLTETLTGVYENYTRTTAIQDNTPRAGIKQVTVTTVAPSGLGVQVVSLIAE